MTKYYTLISRDCPGDLWAPQFGDFDRCVVSEERLDYIDSGYYTARNLRIITTGPEQADIDAAVCRLNSWRRGTMPAPAAAMLGA